MDGKKWRTASTNLRLLDDTCGGGSGNGMGKGAGGGPREAGGILPDGLNAQRQSTAGGGQRHRRTLADEGLRNRLHALDEDVHVAGRSTRGKKNKSTTVKEDTQR